MSGCLEYDDVEIDWENKDKQVVARLHCQLNKYKKELLDKTSLGAGVPSAENSNKGWLSDSYDDEDPVTKHSRIATRVFGRLQYRYAQLILLQELATMEPIHKHLKGFKDEPTKATVGTSEQKGGHGPKVVDPATEAKCKVDAETRAYRLATTDLFVEKALAYLEDMHDAYKRKGRNAYKYATILLIIGIVIGMVKFIGQDLFEVGAWILFKMNIIGNPQVFTAPEEHGDPLFILISSFLKAFTAYGMLVLGAVGFWRYGRAMLDQGERLSDKAHALRQGRLYVHLNDGNIDIKEMEKAFNWNMSVANAYSNLPTEAQAPMGTALKEVATSVTGFAKAAGDLASSFKDYLPKPDEKKKADGNT